MEENKQVEEDFLWSVQLDHDSEVPPFAPDPTTEYQVSCVLSQLTLDSSSIEDTSIWLPSATTDQGDAALGCHTNN